RSSAAPAGRPCSRCGAGTIRSVCHLGRKPSSATSLTPTFASSTPVTSHWRPTPRRSQPRSPGSSPIGVTPCGVQTAPAPQEDTTMEPPLTWPGHEAIDHEDLLVYEWRLGQLIPLGVPWALAPASPRPLDWHQG